MEEKQPLRIALTLSLFVENTVIAFKETGGPAIGDEHDRPRVVKDWDAVIDILRMSRRRVIIDPRYAEEVLALLNGDGLPTGIEKK